ncbi:MAG: hypothetical protein R3C52_12320 [Hyphomonadaceae bacterium]
MLFGLMSSTLLTVLVIPAIYVVMKDPNAPLPAKVDPEDVAQPRAATTSPAE